MGDSMNVATGGSTISGIDHKSEELGGDVLISIGDWRRFADYVQKTARDAISVRFVLFCIRKGLTENSSRLK